MDAVSLCKGRQAEAHGSAENNDLLSAAVARQRPEKMIFVFVFFIKTSTRGSKFRNVEQLMDIVAKAGKKNWKEAS